MHNVQCSANKLSNSKYMLNTNVNVKEAIKQNPFERGLSKTSKKVLVHIELNFSYMKKQIYASSYSLNYINFSKILLYSYFSCSPSL